MDGRDFQLLSLLYQDPLRSHAALGRALGVTPAAARRRLARLQARGVLRGFWALPSASALGLEERILAFEGGRWGERDVRRTLAVPGVVWVARKHDGDLTVQTFTKAGSAAAGRAVSSILGRPPARTHASHGQPLGDAGRLDRLDWRVMAAVVADPTASVGQLAVATGLSAKTVRKRREAMRTAGLLDIQPLLGSLEEEGMLLFHVGVFSRKPLAWKAVKAAEPSTVLVHRIDDPPSLYLFCHAPDLGAAFALQDRLRSIAGVTEVRPSINRELLVNVPRLQAWVNERLAADGTTTTV